MATALDFSRGQVHAESMLRRGIIGDRTTGEFKLLAKHASNASSLAIVTITRLAMPIYGGSQMTLAGPSDLVAIAANVLRGADNRSHDSQQCLWPVFIFSSGRAQTALLNWAVPHLLGDAISHAVVAVVLTPDEEAEYRSHWPNILFLLLPESQKGVSYARHTLHKFCTPRLPFYWAFDDNIVKFGCLEGVGNSPVPISAFQALMFVQRLPNVSKYALVGFLRAIGRESCIVRSFAVDNPTLYKVFLVNTTRCAGVNYVSELTKWQDIAFTRSLMLKGQHVLKVQQVAYYVSAGIQHTTSCLPPKRAPTCLI